MVDNETIIAGIIIPPVSPFFLTIVVDVLHCDPKRALPLAQLVHEKIGGKSVLCHNVLTELAEGLAVALAAFSSYSLHSFLVKAIHPGPYYGTGKDEEIVALSIKTTERSDI